MALKYRFGGKEKRISLGVYPEVGLKDARERRDAARKQLANGVDPGDAKKAQKSATLERTANSFEVIAREWFARYAPGWATSHADKIIQRLERDVFPWLGKHPVAEVTAPQLLTVLRRIEERGAHDTAHRALQNCGQIFRYAVIQASRGDSARAARAYRAAPTCLSRTRSPEAHERGRDQCCVATNGVRHEDGDYGARFPGNGAHHPPRGVARQARSDRAPVGPPRTRQPWHRLQSNEVPQRAPDDDARMGGLSGPRKTRGASNPSSLARLSSESTIGPESRWVHDRRVQWSGRPRAVAINCSLADVGQCSAMNGCWLRAIA